MAQHTQGKKKATLIVIPIVRFTKLIIHHLQSNHKFYPRPGSPLYLPNEESVLGYLKFSAKGTKREVFGMPIPNNLITVDIQGEQYYNGYLEKVAKHQRYLTSEEVSDPDSPAPKPAKATKPKATKQSKPLAPKAAPVTKPAAAKAPKTTASRPPKPTPTTTKPSKKDQSKKHKLVKESSKLVDEFVDEGVPVNDPRFGDEEADLQKALEESSKRCSRGTSGSTPIGELGLTDNETDSDEEVPGTDAGDQDEGQAGPNPGIQDEGQAGSNPGDAAVSQPQPSHVVHAGPNLEHMDVEVTDISIQQNPKQMDEEFITMAYPNFLEEKSQEDEPEKTNTKLKVQSMVTVPIHQDTSSVPLMTTPVIDLTVSQPVSTTVEAPLPTSTATVTAIQAPLRDRFRDLLEADMKEILHHRIWETKSYEAHEDHKNLYEALEKSIDSDHSDQLLTDLAEAQRKKSRSHESSKTPPGSLPHQPPPLPPLAGPSGTSGASGASGLSQLPLPPPPLSTNQTPDAHVHSSDDEYIRNDHILKAYALVSTYAPPPENSLLAQTGDMATFMDWYCKKQRITELIQKDLEGLAFEIVKVFHLNVIHLQYQMEECHKLLTDQVDDTILRYNVSKPLPLGGPQGQVKIQSDFFFNKDLEYLIYGSKGSRPVLSISKIKAAYYPDVGLEQMVPDQMWIAKECKYDIAAIAVRTHMRILSVVRIEVFSLYGYDYMKKIVLRRADLQEYIIAERDFKYLYLNDFEDLYLLNLQVEDFQLGIESYQTQLNLTKPRWDATGFEFKHDFIVIDSLRAVTFRDKYGVQMIMRFNEIHKFSDDTLQQIDEALDYRVKEFKVNRMNSGLNTRFWTRKDVERSKEFMFEHTVLDKDLL
ncbi:hypothetical protein Tco_1308446 [Tanacetum coccineum]